MKKLLLATSILAGSAGVAAAEVSFSGNAYMGLSNNFDDDHQDFQFIARIRTKVTMTGETDGGLSFGAAFEMHNAGAPDTTGVGAGQTGNSETQGSGTAWVEGSFGKITFGDVGTASDGLIGNVDGVGLELDGHKYNELGYLENDKTAVRYEGTFGDFSVMVGLGQLAQGGSSEQDMSIAFKYSFGDYAVYAGYEDADEGAVTQTTIGADATFGNFTVKFRAQDFSGNPDPYLAISGTGKFDAISVTAYYAQHGDLGDAYGIGGSYDLGGGASFKAGAAQISGPGILAVDDGETIIDMGLKFEF